MNIAIIIAVSKYTQPTTDLPACTNDAAVMNDLLDATEKFDHILNLSTDTTSTSIKTQLSQFIKNHHGKDIGEVFFYYSGHGDIYKDSFQFLFSDYSERQKAQTSLSNDELDELLRSLNPKFTVKVVDACFSATTYIKEPDALGKQLNKSKGKFSYCYFMFSSLSDQTSLSDKNLSFFTKAFYEACLSFTGNEIRYQDIADYIADYFGADPMQTPVFVAQSTLTETFCTKGDSIKQLLLKQSQSELTAYGTVTNLAVQNLLPRKVSLLEAVKAHSVEYCTKDETKQFFAGLQKHIEQGKFLGEAGQIYRIDSFFTPVYYNVADDLSAVGSWLNENRKDYFADTTYKSEPYQELLRTLDAFGIPSRSNETTTKYREILSGIQITAEVTYVAIKLLATPLFENLSHVVGSVVFVFSKTEVVFFYCFQVARELDWGNINLIHRPKWLILVQKLKSDLTGSKSAANLLGKFEEYVEQSGRKRVGLLAEIAEKS